MTDDVLLYLLRRAARERARAAEATDPETRAAHDWLAAHYDAQVRERETGTCADPPIAAGDGGPGALPSG